MIESGLFVSPTRDKFFGRVIFPIANTMGNTVAFTGRILQNGEPKYLNSPASRIFDFVWLAPCQTDDCEDDRSFYR